MILLLRLLILVMLISGCRNVDYKHNFELDLLNKHTLSNETDYRLTIWQSADGFYEIDAETIGKDVFFCMKSLDFIQNAKDFSGKSNPKHCNVRFRLDNLGIESFFIQLCIKYKMSESIGYVEEPVWFEVFLSDQGDGKIIDLKWNDGSQFIEYLH